MSRVEDKSNHFKTTSPTHQHHRQSTSRPLSQIQSNTMNTKQQQQQDQHHSHRTNNPNNLLNNNHISQRNSTLNPNHFIQSPHLQTPPRQVPASRHSYCGAAGQIPQQPQPHFLNRPQFPTHAPLQIPNQFNPLTYKRLSYMPNSHHVSYHQASNSIHSLHGLPTIEVPNVNPIQASFESPHSSPSSTNTSYPISSILNSPRSPLSKIANHQESRSSSHDQPERIVTGILRSSLPPQQRPDQPTLNQSQSRPQSMSFTELSARHRLAISRFQQKPRKSNDPSPQLRSSSLSKSLSSPSTSPSHSPIGSRLMNSTNQPNKKVSKEKDSKRRKSVESHEEGCSPTTPTHLNDPRPNHQSNRSSLSPYVKSLKQIQSGQKLSDQSQLNQAERRLLDLLPPLPPPNLIIQKKSKPSEIKEGKTEGHRRFKDRFSWFDY
ncbi:uncharacterized protein MELLADRAFT_58711 [Melampsora larici-populina 98AG31]|uniref:Uncharacterized protein n=1 Tax=Melampsora larici-populina (strain 98AG31 / pathotype 3-4-7) TaxID=747676 RepID=F4R4J7_MELLP|nr:uncharacterized protein MELLADRAFT_58711 [Melampsora larici-populina 98AG31]EGG12822.1 hypothetical protein MELLADRAFT_58711 [Melampsora larici-populina 98AG31]